MHFYSKNLRLEKGRPRDLNAGLLRHPSQAVSKLPSLILVSNVFMRNRIYPFLFTDRVYKTPYTKNSEYESGFEEMSVLFNEKTFKIQKRKSKMPSDPDRPRIHFVASRDVFVFLLSYLKLM